MITQKFKGDETELKMEAAGKGAFDSTSLALDQYLAGGYQASNFLLMLYDQERVPFVDRVKRDAFVAFMKEAVRMFPFTGTFDAYLFILRAIFGAGSEILFTVPAAGKLEILVNAESALSFQFIGTELVDGIQTEFNMTTMEDDLLEFKGLSGIDSQAELEQLLAELIPAGIFPEVTLTFFVLSSFVAEDDLSNLDSVIDYLGNQIVFFELGS